MQDIVNKTLKQITNTNDISPLVLRRAHAIFVSGECQMLTQAKSGFDFTVSDEYDDFHVHLAITDNSVDAITNQKEQGWNHLTIAALLQLSDEIRRQQAVPKIDGKKYTREGMIKRVLTERREKALKADYRIEFADNIYGEHVLTNERGVRYKITLRDFKNETGYINCADLQTNKLGTTKHIMYAFQKLKSDKKLFDSLLKNYPFIEVYLDPLNDYRITWYYPHKMEPDLLSFFSEFFGDENWLPEEKTIQFLQFIHKAKEYKQILIRPEVLEKVEKAFDRKTLKDVTQDYKIDFSILNIDLLPYQKKGIEFAAFRDGAVIADDMGLGKTVQAIGSALVKKHLFDFKRCLVVCPASLKEQWQKEIQRFCGEKAVLVQGLPSEREKIYHTSDAYFYITNYESVMRDFNTINKKPMEYIILDEAQRIKNYLAKTTHAVKSLKKKHSLVITGTPIENRLVDLYSIMGFVDPEFLSPLWEFSYQHCLFDAVKKDKITGYYDLDKLKQRLSPILLRREKAAVLKQLPHVTELNVPVNMHPVQEDYHASYAQGVAYILSKKYITPFDMQKLMLLLTKMRAVCDSSYLVDYETHHSPKLIELDHILMEKLDIMNTDRKVIIFTEWIRMSNIIAGMLRKNDIGFVELNSKVPVKKRGKLVEAFEQKSYCKIFLSTEAGGTGLNLQTADTVINFELPWNPAKKNQRFGRIDRIGQKKHNLTIINLITNKSIEEKIAAGLTLKQDLFDGVLNPSSETKSVDFSAKGRSQFLEQLKGAIQKFEEPVPISGEEQEENVIPIDSFRPESEEHPDDAEFEPASEQSLSGNIVQLESETETTSGPVEQQKPEVEEMEHVLNQGLNFLAGLYKMSTGKKLTSQEQKIEVNKETGEVVIRFKLPVKK
ncbi:DEAD/DEAH box helicase [candidate division KSB1 bacterium]|nr:DEAD/DEAH box helicase [candidate division KSB1 bacterium]